MHNANPAPAPLGTHVRDLPTPCVIIDLDVLDRNTARMARAAAEAGVALRPMVKTHKSVYVAALQGRHGSCGCLVATGSEAGALTGMGVHDIVLAYPPLGAGVEGRVRALAAAAQITV